MNQDKILSRSNTLWMQGASALLIMLMHFVMQLDSYPRFFNIFGSVAVAVFLFISGFGINESYKKNGLSSFWKKRLLRVIIPCWLVYLFQLPFVSQFHIGQLIHNLLFINSDLWFVDYIIKWYIVYWCSRKWLPKQTLYILAIYAIYNIFQQQLYSEQAFSFLFGYWISEKYDTICKLSRKSVSKYATAMVIYGIIFLLIKELPSIHQQKGSLLFNFILLNIKLPLATGIIVMPYLLPFVKRNGIISFLGTISYELYIVHYNFMPCITGLSSIAIYSAISIIISITFQKLNQLAKDKNTLIYYFSSFLYIGICYILICKYSMRATSHYGYVCIAYIWVLANILVVLIRKNIFSNTPHNKRIYYTTLCLLVISLLVVQYHFDPIQNKVDRWSAIAYPLEYLFSGKFPYLAPTHLGGNASPFPIWMVFHIPFYLLGNVGLSEIFTCILFVYSIKVLHGYRTAILSILLLFLCINLWYEVSVRSDLISNFLLLATFVNLLIAHQQNLDNHPWKLSILIGLWLSTRLSVAFPLLILFFPSYRKMKMGKQLSVAFIIIGTFALTFAPLIVWDANNLFEATNNPFSLQFRQGNPIVALILLTLALGMALSWKKNKVLMQFYCAMILALIPTISYVFTMYRLDNWTDIFHSIYDITYLDASIPFCITTLALFWNKEKISFQR